MFRGHFVFSRWMAGSCLSEPVSFCRIEKTKDRVQSKPRGWGLQMDVDDAFCLRSVQF